MHITNISVNLGLNYEQSVPHRTDASAGTRLGELAVTNTVAAS